MTLINETSILAADLCEFENLENLKLDEIISELQKKYGIDIDTFGKLMKDIQSRLTVDFSLLDFKISVGFRPINLNDGSLIFQKQADENLLENREKFIEYTVLETEKKNKYIISVSEEYFYRTYKDWEIINHSERMNIRNTFVREIEAFLLGTASKGIVEMRFIDQNKRLQQAVTIVPINNIQKNNFLKKSTF